MHELAITQSMLELVTEHAEKASATKVGKINLVIGELSGFVGECVQFYFDFLSKGTIAEGAQLCFRVVPTTARCRDCDKTFEVKESDWSCPHCQGDSLQLVGGNELLIESIEVD